MYKADTILEVQNLVTQFHAGKKIVRAVNNVSFTLARGSTLGIVGESGSGKSSMALSLMRLIDPHLGQISGTTITIEGNNILLLAEKEMKNIRGNRMSMIFQEPMTSLNPVFTIGYQIIETLQLHQQISKKEATERCIELLNLVKISAPHQRMKDYPHQVSGGMRQRVMIAIALACSPSVLIADEPTTALDVTTQAQIIDLMQKLQEETHMGIILITHDLGLVAEMCDQVAVMYCGRIIEKSSVKEIFEHPLHPYTYALLDSMPGGMGTNNDCRLKTIPGMVPPLHSLPVGCNFQDRCFQVGKRCTKQEPLLEALEAEHSAACFYPLHKADRSKLKGS